jgi:hyperosmotically inducible periplasmic protein
MSLRVCRALMVLALFGFLAFGQETKPPDNTGQNKRDRKADAVTADKQSNAATGRALLQAIRKAVVAEPNFSINAQNVKIVVRQGLVTLRGPVKNDLEKKRIEELATAAGAAKIVNRIEIPAGATK